MTIEKKLLLRLQFLARVVTKEHQHLTCTDQRLFADGATIVGFKNIDNDIDLAERIDAFVSRFCRLQDTLGDKLLPTLLSALGEQQAAHLFLSALTASTNSMLQQIEKRAWLG